MQRIGALVSSGWLSKILAPQTRHLRVLDGTWHLPTSNLIAKDEYDREHIPGAEFFDIEGCSLPHSKFSQTLPTPEQFSEYVGSLGICNDTHVIVYDNHPDYGLFSAPRVWWMFRVFGHNNVSVLDGGLPQWIKEGNPVIRSTGPSEVEKMTFETELKPDLYKSFRDMIKNLDTKTFQVMDARSKKRYMGEALEPREGLDRGHIPSSKNVPFSSLLQDKDSSSPRLLKSPEELKQIFESKGIDLSTPITASCGSGITACFLALAAHEAGKKNVAVFDGSWEEYASRATHDQMILCNPIDASVG